MSSHCQLCLMFEISFIISCTWSQLCRQLCQLVTIFTPALYSIMIEYIPLPACLQYQTGLMEDDFLQGFLGFNLCIKRISATAGHLYQTICVKCHDRIYSPDIMENCDPEVARLLLRGSRSSEQPWKYSKTTADNNIYNSTTTRLVWWWILF